MLDLFDRKHSLPWLIALSMLSAGIGQVLLLSAAPHQVPVRHAPHVVIKRLASSLQSHSAVSLPSPQSAAE